MNFSGILVGAAVFFCIGICHPAVIKMEYHLGKKSWWIWLAVGLLVSAASLFVSNQTVSTILGGFAFSCSGVSLRCTSRRNAYSKGGFPRIPRGTPIMNP